MATEVTRTKILDTLCVVEVDTNGWFSVHVEDEERVGYGGIGNGDTYDKAIQKARESLRKMQVKVEVPFRTATGALGVANGLHRTTGNVLTRVNGKAEQYSYYNSKTFREDTPAEVFQHRQEAVTAMEQAKTAIREIDQKWGFDLGRAVKKAVAEKADENLSVVK